MAEITVAPAGGGNFRVTVTDSGSTTSHDVTLDAVDASRLGLDCSEEELVEASFRFLLDREPKESILGQFDLSVIARYFPEYPSRIGDYL